MSTEKKNIDASDIEELRKKLQQIIAGKHITRPPLDQKCYFCEEKDADPTTSPVVHITHKTSKYSQEYTVKKISVPRCEKCHSVHDLAGGIGCIPSGILFIVLVLILYAPAFGIEVIPFKGLQGFLKNLRSTGDLGFLLLLLIMASPFWLPALLYTVISYIVPDFLSGRSMPLREAYNYPPAKEAWRKQNDKFPIFSKRKILSDVQKKDH